MTAPRRRAARRTDPLSQDRIVVAAIELLDTSGADGLTTRALTERLATGTGAIYHRVGTKDELLALVTETVLARALRAVPAKSATPDAAVNAVALGLFDAAVEHPWLSNQIATQLSRNPWGPVGPHLFETLGRPVHALGLPESAWFTATSALVHHILGATGLHAAAAADHHARRRKVERTEVLHEAATAWEDLDPDTYPTTRTMAARLRAHDDREELLAGVSLILDGIRAHRAAT